MAKFDVVKLTAISAAAVLFAASAAVAGQKSGTSTGSMNQEYRESGANMGPGASSNAPGHKMKQHRSVTRGPSKYAPGHEMRRSNRGRD